MNKQQRVDNNRLGKISGLINWPETTTICDTVPGGADVVITLPMLLSLRGEPHPVYQYHTVEPTLIVERVSRLRETTQTDK